jgi:nucleoside-diphosphate-sugar epimerase
MTLLVTGGFGFVGLNLAEYFSRVGKPIVLMSPSAPPKNIMHALKKHQVRHEWFQGDVREAKDLDLLCKEHQITKIIHAAAITAELAREVQHTKEIFEVNLLGSIEVFECALRHRIEQVIQLSSGSLFGNIGLHDPLIDEINSPVLPVTMYGISKLAAERVALRYRTTRKLNVTVVRLGLVYGRWEYDTGVRDTLSLPLQLYWMAKNNQHAKVYHAVGSDYVYSTDVAMGLGLILEKGSSVEGLYHLSSAQVWSLQEWLQQLQQKFPSFTYQICDQKEDCNVGLIGPLLRSPMSIHRIKRDFDYAPSYDQQKAFLDFVSHHEELL